MNFGLHELLTSCLALVCLPVFFLAPGYAAASATNLLNFQGQSWIERLLWATALSEPLALWCTVHPGLGLSPRATTASMVACALAACGLALRDKRHPASAVRTLWNQHATLCAMVALALVPYVLLSVLPIAVHGGLYESAVWQDWNVRIQLVNAAIRGGNAPGNPMFAPDGQPAPLHYYFFWYVLCARMHDLVPVDARAILTASCVGAGLSLLAFLLLAVKYLSPSRTPVRRQATAALLGAAILGLDLIPVLFSLLNHRFYADLQFWLDERSPGWLHMVLWAPHHVAGLVGCGIGTLLFVRAPDVSPRQQRVHTVLAGICFAAAIGSSSFIALLFAAACAVLLADALRRREWAVVRTIATAGLLAAVLIAPFLQRVLFAANKDSRGTDAPRHVVQLGMRYRNQSRELLWLTFHHVDPRLTRHALPGNPGANRLKWLLRVLRPPYIALLLVFDLGFFLLVLGYQARKDLFRKEPMDRPSRVLWMLFFGMALPGFFLTSGGLQNNNDLGRHAGFCLRLFLLLWSAPLIAAFLDRRRASKTAFKPLPLSFWARCSVAFAGIGLAGQIAQILLVRTRFALTDAGQLPRVVVEERVPRLAFRFGQIQSAMEAATHTTPPDGIVQGNPHSRLRNVLLLYTNRQMAASDDGCNTPFGGDPRQCLPMARSLIQLFGGTGAHYHGAPNALNETLPLEPSAVTPENFARLCATYKLSAVVATYVDPVWWDRASWVWQLRPSYRNSTARVFACPAPARAAQKIVSENPGSSYTDF